MTDLLQRDVHMLCCFAQMPYNTFYVTSSDIRLWRWKSDAVLIRPSFF